MEHIAPEKAVAVHSQIIVRHCAVQPDLTLGPFTLDWLRRYKRSNERDRCNDGDRCGDDEGERESPY